MTTKTIHSFHDQVIEIDGDQVSMILHNPLDKDDCYPLLQIDLMSFLDGIAFLANGKIDVDQFFNRFKRIPANNWFCYKCECNKLGINDVSFCAAKKCIRGLK